MFDQRNQSFQTVILSASVMFSSLSTVIIQGYDETFACNSLCRCGTQFSNITCFTKPRRQFCFSHLHYDDRMYNVQTSEIGSIF